MTNFAQEPNDSQPRSANAGQRRTSIDDLARCLHSFAGEEQVPVNPEALANAQAKIRDLALESKLFDVLKRRILLQKARLLPVIPAHRPFRERDVVEEFPEASTLVVRSALFRLVNDSLLEFCVDGTFRVPPFAASALVEAYEMRLLLEIPALWKANQDPSIRAELIRLNDRLLQVPDVDDEAGALAAFEHDIKFHQTMLQRAGRQLGAREALRCHHLILIWNVGIRVPERRAEVHAEHAEILNAQTPQAAIDAYINHFRQGTQRSLVHAGQSELVATFDRLWRESTEVALHQVQQLA